MRTFPSAENPSSRRKIQPEELKNHLDAREKRMKNSVSISKEQQTALIDAFKNKESPKYIINLIDGFRNLA